MSKLDPVPIWVPITADEARARVRLDREELILSVLPKLRRSRPSIDASGRDIDLDLEIDGGVEPGSAKELIAVGADLLVAEAALRAGGGRAGAS
jgi:ribulose-phosphate 3-epimerase